MFVMICSTVEQLRDRLATAQSANEMFRVCSKFNALFFRPRVRGAVREYQAQVRLMC
jgi:dynein heavy chain 1